MDGASAWLIQPLFINCCLKPAIVMEKEISKQYSNGEIIITWKPGLCIHSGNCFTGLPHVFDPGRRPWISPSSAPTAQILEQVRKCPSGALSAEPDSSIQER